MNAENACDWIRLVAARVHEQRDVLTELDREIGDGDHGTNLDRGFSAAMTKLDECVDVGDVFLATGRTLISVVGGASGPLYGTLFRTLGRSLRTPDADAAAFGSALQAAVERVEELGGARPGDKTMVDVLLPVAAAFSDASERGFAEAARAAAMAAEKAADATVQMRARKGRASYLGERSVGHKDPGAASTALVFAALADVVS